MYYLMFLLFVSCAITFVKAAVPQSLHEKMFHDWDKNKDGKLVKYELPKNLKQNFIQVDNDNNGYISISEHITFVNHACQYNIATQHSSTQMHCNTAL